MLFFSRKKMDKKDALKEAEIQAIRTETLENVTKTNKTIDKASSKIRIFNQIISDESATAKIFLATGGDRRIH